MKRREWILYVFLPLLLVWGVDRVTKIWAETLVGMNFYGPVGFVLHHNHGAILGLFSNLPNVLRIVSLSTFGGFLLFSFFIIQYLLPIRSVPMRIGMSILIGGITGNVADRIVYGYVIDFLMFGSVNSYSPAMNLADVLQWFGYGLITVGIIKDGKHLWPEENLRKSYWINPKYQLRYCFSLMGFGFGMSMIGGIFSYTYMRVTIQNLVGTNDIIEQKFLFPYAFTFFIITIAISLFLFYIGLVLSHRAAGPVYAFGSFVKDLANGKFRTLKLRSKDEFTHLEDLAAELNEKFKSVVPDDNLTQTSDEQLNLPLENKD